MTGVLCIAYHYPPMHTVGVWRAAGFVRHLPMFGYRPHVLTASTYGGESTPDTDRAYEILGLYRLLFNRNERFLPPAQRSQTRTRAGVISSLAGWCKRHFLIPDAQIGWLPHALWLGLAAIRRWNLRILWTTAPPYSAHCLGYALKALTGLPWVADFRDTWTYDPLDENLLTFPARLACERALETGVLRYADRVVGVTGAACEDFRSRFPRIASRVRLIPNGFDTDDSRSEWEDGYGPEAPFCLVHTGSFSYSNRRRSPGPLFEALRTWQAECPGLADRFRMVLVGALSPEEELMAAPFEKSGLVQLTGSLSREEALHWQRRAHVLLLVSRRAANIPLKCYEYLAAGRPILALAPLGATRDLVDSLQAGVCAPPDDSTAILAAMKRLFQAYLEGRLMAWRASPEALRPFDRRALAGQLGRCFDEVLRAYASGDPG